MYNTMFASNATISNNRCNAKDRADIKEKILYFDNNNNRNMKDVVSILLLEEMFFFLDEMVSYPSTIGKEVIDRFTYELDHIDWSKIQ